MEDSVSPDVRLEILKRKRAHRRGQITRIQKRLTLLQSRHPREIGPSEIDVLMADLAREIDVHEELHEQIEDLLTEDATALSNEQSDRATRDDTHSALRLELYRFKQKLTVWNKGTGLCSDLNHRFTSGDPSNSAFRHSFQTFAQDVSTLAGSANQFMEDELIKSIIQTLRDGVYAIQRDIDASAARPPPSTTSDTPTPSPKAAPITVGLPKFDGNPLKWQLFETAFSAAIKTRAAGFSNLDIKSLLSDALQTEEAKQIIRSHPIADAPLDDLLRPLRLNFGRPQIVVPLLIQKMDKPATFADTYEGLNALTKQFLMNYDELQPLIGDSFSQYVAYKAKACLEKPLRDDWEKYASEKLDKPTVKDLRTFVEQRLLYKSPSSTETAYSIVTSSTSSSLTTPSSTSSSTPYSLPVKKKQPSKCIACGDNHSLMRCTTFVGFDVERRNKLVRDKRSCVNCLSDQHTCRLCPSKHSCKTCGGRHHTLLHRDREYASPNSSTTTSVGTFMVAASPTADDQMSPSFPHTITVTLENQGRTVRARAILDAGAGVSVMSEKLATDLRLKRHPHKLVLSGSFSNETCKFFVVTNLFSHSRSFKSDPIKFTVVSRIKPVPVPDNRDEILKLPSLSNTTLADPELGGEVDIFIGNMDMDRCIHDGVLRFDGFKAIHTPFGLSIAGPLQPGCPAPTFLTTAIPDDLQNDLSKLWELDQVPEAPSHSPIDVEVIQEFHDTYQRVNGRFSVSLPKVKSPQPLGDSRRQAVKRLLSNEKSLSSKGKLSDFNNVLQEYLDLGHAHIIPANERYLTPHFYLPVHGVFKDSSTTTKLRAVFDASAKSSTGISLNDNLLPGPNLYPPLQDVITRFRRHKVGLSADISKMFREILLNPPDRDLHRFLMRDKCNTIVDCRMERLTFGVTCSPYLATQVLRTLSHLFCSSHPVASSTILSDFYVDDLLSGADDVEAANQLRIELCDLLSQAGMTLRKWRSNSEGLRQHIPEHLLEKDPNPITFSQPHRAPKALGIHWDVDHDTLHISIPPPTPPASTVTKRVIASGTAGVFDVLGLFSPAIIPARILFQETWKRSLPWDKPVPEDIKSSWDIWINDLPEINKLAIPRRLNPSNSKAIFSSLHGFCDASSVAYGAAIYLRTISEDGSTSTTLVVAKARVLPVKHVTIPRAELLGAHLLAKMLVHTSELLDIPSSHIFAWTDSEIVLYWIPKSPSQLERFIANRVHAIQDLVPPSSWRHVRSADNPADLASRGVRAPVLATSLLWWSGPPWLLQSPDKWPVHKLSKPAATVQCLSIQPTLQPVSTQKRFLEVLWKKFSSFHLLNKVIAWIYRFAHNAKPKNKDKLQSTLLTSEEVLRAKLKIFKLSQQDSFPEVFSAINRGNRLPKSHSLYKSTISISKYGHLVISSRVRDINSPTSPKQLIPLSTKSSVTKLLVRSLHSIYSHAGISALASIISATYYIPNLRNLLKFISRTCPSCQRAYAVPLTQRMGMLPTYRTTPAPPFDRTGVDFAGPFVTRQGYTRKPTLIKTYAAVFICMCTKAVHIELCSSLSTDDFMATLKRFVARRGCPSHIYSDNGTNFLGAREEIRELQALTESKSTKKEVANFAAVNNIQWHHTPPRAPHFGGLWEAAVKSMKSLLRKNLKPHSLRYEELYTLLTEIEAILNSRPLSPLHSDDITEGSYLTAGHFLIGRPLKAAPSPQPPTGEISNLKRWNLVSRLTADLWKQWLGSYLSSCSQRTKWNHPGRRLEVNDLVYIKDETLKIRDWPLAIIEETFPGDDNEVRTVKLRCRGKSYKRSTDRVIPFTPDEPTSN